MGKSKVRYGLIGAVIVLFAISLVLCVWVLRPSKGQLVEVVSDGQVLYTFDLSKKESRYFTVFYGDSSNTICLEDGEIWVASAQCPDRTCVEMGKLHSESLPIVCLPNRLIIRYAE